MGGQLGGLAFNDGYLALNRHPVFDRRHEREAYGDVADPSEMLATAEDVAVERERLRLIREHWGNRPYFLVDMRASLPFFFSGRDIN